MIERQMERRPAAGLRPAVVLPRMCGPAIGLSAGHLLGSGSASARLRHSLNEMLCNGEPVAIRVSGLGRGRTAIDRLSRLCEALARALEMAGHNASRLELTLSVAALPPRAAVQIRRATLGQGVVNLVVDETTMAAALDSRPHVRDRAWLHLWQLRDEPAFTAFWPAVRSCCPLLTSEPAMDMIPDVGLQAPRESAFLYCRLDLIAFADACGAIDMQRLETVLCKTIDDGDAMHDVCIWPTPTMQQDGWFNRRLAIDIVGIGDVVLRRGLDPESHATVRKLDVLVASVRRMALEHSRRMSRVTETLPAIDATNPCRQLQSAWRKNDWQQRWLRAIEKSALRHRNLLMMSPWSVFPRHSSDYRFANLLPLLAHADACGFRHRPCIQSWNIREFVQFHRRAWAIRRRNEAAMVVAERL